MSEIDYGRLVFRKQFLITAKKIDGLCGWKRHDVCFGRKTLYAHPDIEVTKVQSGGKRVVLIGYVLDWKRVSLGNADILRAILEESEGFDGFAEAAGDIGGRFAIIYEDENVCMMLHDAGGQREVYYHLGEHGVSCAAQLPIMKKFLDVEENPDKGIVELYNSDIFLSFKKQWVGDQTIYMNTRSLKPNHCLDLERGIVSRYWPKRPIESINVEYAVEMAAEMMKGFLKAASLRERLLIPVTAGWDSRVILAASKGIDNITYYVIKFEHMDDSHEDIAIPKRLMKRLGMEFSVIEITQHVDERFAQIFGGNTAYAKEANLAGIYNVFFKMFPGRINVSSQMSEVIRSYRGDTGRYRKNYYDVCVAYGSRNEYYRNEYVKRVSSKWIESGIEFAHDMNIDPAVMFYWEEWLVWEASQRSETDIAIEEYPLLSCRKLMELLIGVEPMLRNKYECGLYKKLMEKMWPQVLSEPINPSIKRRIKGALVAMDMFYPLRNAIRRMGRG